MQRMAWTDERLEERFDGIDRRFDEVDKRFEQVDRRFDRVEGEIVELRREMHLGFASIQATLNRTNLGMILGLLGLITAVVAKG